MPRRNHPRAPRRQYDGGSQPEPEAALTYEDMARSLVRRQLAAPSILDGAHDHRPVGNPDQDTDHTEETWL